ncbi:MAG: ABC transporter ATP-binding protein [Candidatus Sabulitectum sp.]|nr:ABC transporter ATP-binding protein [Candidatus Sabulitectum sp.]
MALHQFKRIFPFLEFRRKKVGVFLAISVILSGVSVVTPMITRQLINMGISQGSSSAIIWSVVGLSVLGITRQLMVLNSQTLEIGISQNIIESLRKRLAEDISWLTNLHQIDDDSGYLISRVQSDAQSIGTLIKSLSTLGNQLLVLLSSVILMHTILSSSILVVFPIVILISVVGFLAYNRIHKLSLNMMESNAKAFGSIGELIEGKDTLILQGGGKEVTSEVIRKQSNHIMNVKRLLLTNTRIGVITGTIRTLAVSVMLAWSGFRVVSGSITFGDWYAVNLYAGLVLGASVSASLLFRELGQTSAAISRVMELLMLAEKEREIFSQRKSSPSIGGVDVRNITFSYENGQEIFSDLSFFLPPNKLALITGPSGVGKTTLCNIISGHLKPNTGEIRIGNSSPIPIGHASEKGNVAVLPQEVFLFNATILENIRLGRSDATDEEIVGAATLAGIHSDILLMNNGYNTIAGPKGKRLSLGQKRRIALARTMLSNPSLIILDEPFASLDTKNVQQLSKTILNCKHYCCVIVISHGWDEYIASDICIDLPIL